MSLVPDRDHAKLGVKLTYDDYVLFPDDGMRHELIDGERYVTASPNMYHQDILGCLYHSLATWLETHRVGSVYVGPVDVLFSHFDIVAPDMVYLSHERARRIQTEKLLAGAPELVVEIGSPSTRRRDETIKRGLYERFGVDEYWIADPRTNVMLVSRRTGETFGDPLALSRDAGDVLTTPLLPGFELPLVRVFREPQA